MVLNKPTRQIKIRRRPIFRVRSPHRNWRSEADLTLEEQLQDIDEASNSDGEDCEIHYYEERYDTQGELVCLRVGTKSAIEIQKSKSHRACLVRTRTYDVDRELLNTTLEIQSQHIQKALKEVIGSYVGNDFSTPIITIYHPLEPLFHYRKELQDYANRSVDSKIRSHVNLCLRYMKYSLSREISLFDRTFASESSKFEIDHENLWIAYKPGDLIYKRDGKVDTVSRLHSFEEKYTRNIRSWIVSTERIEYDGTDFGHVIHNDTFIAEFPGRVCIRDLKAFPLRFHSQNAQIRDALVQRGQKYVSLRGACHRFFNGIAKFPMEPPIGVKEVHVQHRVVIDMVAYRSYKSNSNELGDFNLGARVFRTAPESTCK
ncbi:hypothetical protein EV127DRAFT_77855 [Xylaria flabelliformis]|nr:hypothetical protein EV127DRAFT_77855 [Xylaria flabelliformis]